MIRTYLYFRYKKDANYMMKPLTDIINPVNTLRRILFDLMSMSHVY